MSFLEREVPVLVRMPFTVLAWRDWKGQERARQRLVLMRQLPNFQSSYAALNFRMKFVIDGMRVEQRGVEYDFDHGAVVIDAEPADFGVTCGDADALDRLRAEGWVVIERDGIPTHEAPSVVYREDAAAKDRGPGGRFLPGRAPAKPPAVVVSPKPAVRTPADKKDARDDSGTVADNATA